MATPIELARIIKANWSRFTAANKTLLTEPQNYPLIVIELTKRPQVPNPVTVAPQVPKAITLKAIMAVVPAAEMVKCYQLPGFIDDVRRAIDADDREYMNILIQIAAAANAITSGANSSVSKLTALLAQTEADPNWTATIPGDALAPDVDERDVQAADIESVKIAGESWYATAH